MIREGRNMRKRGLPLLVLPMLAFAGIATVPLSGLAQERPPRRPPQVQERPQEGIDLNFQNVPLANVVTAMGQLAGINVVSSNMPDVTVTLRTAEPVSPEEVASLIRSLASAHGVTVVEEPGFLRLQGPLIQEGEPLEPRQLYIHRLRHANALVLAGTLQSLFGATGPRIGAATPRAETLSQQLQQIEQLSGQRYQGAQLQGGQVTFNVGSGELEGDVMIVPDEITNSLLIRATAGDWTVLEQAILALDLRPLQVVIEVVIAEVRRSGNLDVGVGFFATDVDEEGGEGVTGILPVDPGENAFTLDILRTGDVNVGATLSALSTTGNVRILSRPLIQAQNNQEARILVGSQRPFIQSSYTSVQNPDFANEVVQYRNVGTSLTILPTINEEGYVNLTLTQEVSSATAETQFGAPVISTREATTQILAQTGQTVVVGGLVDRQTEETRIGIPFLKDIPILGYLFGTRREVVANSELFLFLTPYVVGDDADEEALKEAIEGNAELLEELIPIRSILPPVLQAIVPDSILPDTIRPDTIGGGGRQD
ncbi:MAG: secretin N-terminal domain-containing protein [Gemmatimonadota bacterium]|jgi:type II secretory pathway component GspD/PulD (secretin)